MSGKNGMSLLDAVGSVKARAVTRADVANADIQVVRASGKVQVVPTDGPGELIAVGAHLLVLRTAGFKPELKLELTGGSHTFKTSGQLDAWLRGNPDTQDKLKGWCITV